MSSVLTLSFLSSFRLQTLVAKLSFCVEFTTPPLSIVFHRILWLQNNGHCFWTFVKIPSSQFTDLRGIHSFCDSQGARQGLYPHLSLGGAGVSSHLSQGCCVLEENWKSDCSDMHYCVCLRSAHLHALRAEMSLHNLRTRTLWRAGAYPHRPPTAGPPHDPSPSPTHTEDPNTETSVQGVLALLGKSFGIKGERWRWEGRGGTWHSTANNFHFLNQKLGPQILFIYLLNPSFSTSSMAWQPLPGIQSRRIFGNSL